MTRHLGDSLGIAQSGSTTPLSAPTSQFGTSSRPSPKLSLAKLSQLKHWLLSKWRDLQNGFPLVSLWFPMGFPWVSLQTDPRTFRRKHTHTHTRSAMDFRRRGQGLVKDGCQLRQVHLEHLLGGDADVALHARNGA